MKVGLAGNALFGLLLAAGACRGQSSSGPPGTAPEASVAAPEEAAVDAGSEDAAAPTRTEPDGNDPATATVLIVNGDAAPEEYIDRSGGLVWLEYRNDDDGPSPSGKRTRARHLCGARLSTAYHRLSMLAEAHEGVTLNDVLCSGTVCSVPGVSAGLPDYDLYFTRSDRGLRLDTVAVVLRATVSEESAAAAERWVEKERQRLSGKRCAK